MVDFLEVISPGCGAAWQDAGRPGWKRFGVPRGGWMDPAAAGEANRLAGNGEDAVVLELVLQGAQFRVLAEGWLALAGASMGWRPGTVRQVAAGDVLRFTRHESGVYAYLAVQGGWTAPRFLGSAGVSHRCGIGRPLERGEVLVCAADPSCPPPACPVGAKEQISVDFIVEVPVWRGPQWQEFSPETRATFFSASWKVSSRSDRMGVRLEGPTLQQGDGKMISEPVAAGAVQITGAGQPIVIMPDGPTVGGYPKIAWLDREACCRVAQIPPGGTVRFNPPRG